MNHPSSGNKSIVVCGVIRKCNVDGIVFVRDRCEFFGVFLRRRRIRLHDQHGTDILVETEIPELIEHRNGETVQHLKHGRAVASAHVGGNRFCSVAF